MSLPQFPTTSPTLTREEAINQIISSIAMEELGISHIINAEGEKLQFVLGTIPGISGPAATIEDVLKVNESIRSVLQSAAETQSILRAKLQNALSSYVLTGPTGPSGPAGAHGKGAIMSFSSGKTAMSLHVDSDGDPTAPVLIGYGTSDAGEFDGEKIDLKDLTDEAATYAFVIPREGKLTDFTAYFFTEDLPLLTDPGTVEAGLYLSDAPGSYSFKKMAGATLKPEIKAATPLGAVHTGKAEDIPKGGVTLPAGSRLVLAFTGKTGKTLAGVELKGYGSAAVSIA